MAIVDHHFYIIGDVTDKLKGFYGKHFKILFKDGRTVDTDNLWNGSLIPEEFRKQFPDNAEFLPVEPLVDPNSL